MRFATWNMDQPGTERAHRLVRFLKSREWDIVALQEVSRRAWEVIAESGVAESSAYALEFFERTPLRKRHHGAALLARNGFQLSAPKLVLGLPKAERALVARTTVGDAPVIVASWHAPNAASEGVATKMQAYRGIVDWLGSIGGPISLGFDGNHWNRSTALELPSVPESKDPWLLENRFFGNEPPHRLRDAFLDHLRANQSEYEEIKRRKPLGPLAVSYVRGRKENPIEDRFDYVFVSEEIAVTDCSYDYKGTVTAGSDHGIVTAELRLRR